MPISDLENARPEFSTNCRSRPPHPHPVQGSLSRRSLDSCPLFRKKTTPQLLIPSVSRYRCKAVASFDTAGLFLTSPLNLSSTLGSLSPVRLRSPESPFHDLRRISGFSGARIDSPVAGEHHDCPVDPSSTTRSGCLSLSLSCSCAAFLLVLVVVNHRAKNNRRWRVLPKERGAPSFASLPFVSTFAFFF